MEGMTTLFYNNNVKYYSTMEFLYLAKTNFLKVPYSKIVTYVIVVFEDFFMNKTQIETLHKSKQ